MECTINVEFIRCNEEDLECDGCGIEIVKDQPMYKINFGARNTEIFICEDCGNGMCNDMSDEYSRFVDLGK